MAKPVKPDHGAAPWKPTDGWLQKSMGLNVSKEQLLYFAKQRLKDVNYKLDLSKYNRQQRNSAEKKPLDKKTLTEKLSDTYHGLLKRLFTNHVENLETKLNLMSVPPTKQYLTTRAEVDDQLKNLKIK